MITLPEEGDLVEIHGADSPLVNGLRGLIVPSTRDEVLGHYFRVELDVPAQLSAQLRFREGTTSYWTASNLTVIERFSDKVDKVLGGEYFA